MNIFIFENDIVNSIFFLCFLCRFAEQKAQMNKQEKELQGTMAKYAQELKYGETEIEVENHLLKRNLGEICL